MDKHYLAGFFDGEGYVTWYRRGARLIVGQKTVEILEQIQDYWESLGCQAIHIYHQTYRLKKDGEHAQGYRIQTANCHDIKIILADLMPYLIVKKDDAIRTMAAIEQKRRHTEKLNEEDVVHLKRLGLSAVNIGLFYHCSNRKILKILHKHGIGGPQSVPNAVNPSTTMVES